MIAEAEDAIVAAVKKVLGKTVQTVETLPGPWDQDALVLAFKRMPGVWVYFDGAEPGKAARGGRVVGRFLVYAVTAHASSSRERQRGNRRQIGAYDIVERVIPTLDSKPAADLGTLTFQGLRVLTPASTQRQGVAVYEMRFDLEAALPAPRDAAELADFVIYHADHQVDPGPDIHTHRTPIGPKETSP